MIPLRYCPSIEVYDGYAQREMERNECEKEMAEARLMLVNKDFMDRLYLFMTDLRELPSGYDLEQLPHYGLYFDEGELRQIARYTRLYDWTATPYDVLLSFERVFPPARRLVNGIWRTNDEEYLDWIR